MNRRVFLQTTGSIAGIGLISGGLLIRRTYAIDTLAREMVDETLPLVSESWQNELETVPEKACNEVRKFFHQKCLNVDAFLEVLSGDNLQRELRSLRKDYEREEVVMREFCRHVVSGDAILQHLKDLATELGKNLDESWAGACKQVSTQWTESHGFTNAAEYEILSMRTRELMLKNLRATARNLRSGQDLALGETFTEVGRAALLLIPIKRIGKGGAQVAVPHYIVEALRPYCSYLSEKVGSQNENVQREMSKKLSQLGNHIGDECKKVMTEKVSFLHIIRKMTLMEIARGLAKQQVQFI